MPAEYGGRFDNRQEVASGGNSKQKVHVRHGSGGRIEIAGELEGTAPEGRADPHEVAACRHLDDAAGFFVQAWRPAAFDLQDSSTWVDEQHRAGDEERVGMTGERSHSALQ